MDPSGWIHTWSRCTARAPSRRPPSLSACSAPTRRSTPPSGSRQASRHTCAPYAAYSAPTRRAPTERSPGGSSCLTARGTPPPLRPTPPTSTSSSPSPSWRSESIKRRHRRPSRTHRSGLPSVTPLHRHSPPNPRQFQRQRRSLPRQRPPPSHRRRRRNPRPTRLRLTRPPMTPRRTQRKRLRSPLQLSHAVAAATISSAEWAPFTLAPAAPCPSPKAGRTIRRTMSTRCAATPTAGAPRALKGRRLTTTRRTCRGSTFSDRRCHVGDTPSS